MKSVTSKAIYCACCGKRPTTNNRRVSKRGRKLTICQKCSVAEKKNIG